MMNSAARRVASPCGSKTLTLRDAASLSDENVRSSSRHRGQAHCARVHEIPFANYRTVAAKQPPRSYHTIAHLELLEDQAQQVAERYTAQHVSPPPPARVGSKAGMVCHEKRNLHAVRQHDADHIFPCQRVTTHLRTGRVRSTRLKTCLATAPVTHLEPSSYVSKNSILLAFLHLLSGKFAVLHDGQLCQGSEVFFFLRKTKTTRCQGALPASPREASMVAGERARLLTVDMSCGAMGGCRCGAAAMASDRRLGDTNTDPSASRTAGHSEPCCAGGSASCRRTIAHSHGPYDPVRLSTEKSRVENRGQHPANMRGAAVAHDRARRKTQDPPPATTIFRARAQSPFLARRQGLLACLGLSCHTLLMFMATFSIFLLTSRLPLSCAASPLDVLPHDVMLGITMPRARRLLQSSGTSGGQPDLVYCPRDVVVSGLSPLAWFYAAVDGGLPQYGLPKPSLVTTGFEDQPYVYQWQGAPSAHLALCVRYTAF